MNIWLPKPPNCSTNDFIFTYYLKVTPMPPRPQLITTILSRTRKIVALQTFLLNSLTPTFSTNQGIKKITPIDMYVICITPVINPNNTKRIPRIEDSVKVLFRLNLSQPENKHISSPILRHPIT